MPTFNDFRYKSKPDLLWGGYKYVYMFEPPKGLSIVIKTEEDVAWKLPRFPCTSNIPEQRAFYFYPIYRYILENKIIPHHKNMQAGRRTHPYNYDSENINSLIEITQKVFANPPPPLEKIKYYLYISNQNIFADPKVPFSIRLLSNAIKLSPETIRNLVRNDPDEQLDLHQNDFVIVKRTLDF